MCYTPPLRENQRTKKNERESEIKRENKRIKIKRII
jgi:hypothetical protein